VGAGTHENTLPRIIFSAKMNVIRTTVCRRVFMWSKLNASAAVKPEMVC